MYVSTSCRATHATSAAVQMATQSPNDICSFAILVDTYI